MNVALGCNSVQNPYFYSSLHQKKEEHVCTVSSSQVDTANFNGSECEFIRGLASGEDGNEQEVKSGNCEIDLDKIVTEIEQVFADIKVRVKDSSVVAQGMETFIKRYKQMSTRGNSANAALGSSLHRFGWVFGGTIRSTQGGFLRRGRRIPVNARAAGRRRGNLSRGKGKITPGRPKGIKRAFYPATYTMTARKPAKGKRVHSLSANIASGNQNAGKW